MNRQKEPQADQKPRPTQELPYQAETFRAAPVPNYTLATVCPNCDTPVVRRACKVCCERCGFMWDCSEL